MFDIQEELKKLPGNPGVYLMHGKKTRLSMWVKQYV